MPPDNLFRKVALDRLSSPEQLDQTIQVTSPRGWLALVAIILLLAAVVTWSFIGRIPTRVFGQGILIKPGGVQAINSLSAGQVTHLAVRVGDTIMTGQVVASIFRSEEGAFSQVSYVISPLSGRILEVMVEEGANVTPGTPIASIESTESRLEAVVYIPLAEGKKVREGMHVHISPATVKKEEYGYLLGTIRTVAEFPSTYQGMMRVVQNTKLVDRLGGNEAPIEVFADLMPDPDPNNLSGYLWSSSHGPPSAIHRGTLCSATIIVKDQRPISLVIPALKQILGL